MEKYYIINEINNYNLQDEVAEGKIIDFEMPPFCSGDYSAKIYKDEVGFYIDKKDNFFIGCRDFEIK